MALKEELYLSVRPNIYRNTKSKILENQVDLLQILKKLHKLRIMARQKNDLKKQLQKLLFVAKNEIISIQNKLPTPELPKTIKPVEEKIKIEEEISRRDDIDEQLRIIQEKLKQLNSY